MICVDTSVWIAAFRAPDSDAGYQLRDLLDNLDVLLPLPARFELLAGVGAGDQARLRRNLSAVPTAVPAEQTWIRMEAWIERAARAGERFGFADLLIASLSADHGATLWSLDRDFLRMARLGFVEPYRAQA